MTDGGGRSAGAVSGQTELDQLHRHRVALERAVQVARAVEQLHRGLQSALLMENPPKSVAAKARGFLRQIDQATLAQPLGELQRTVARLDTEVQAGLDDVMAYAAPGCERLALLTDEPAGADMDEVESLPARLSRFRLQARTAVALRLLLKERGADVQPVVLAIPTAVIEAGVEAVRQRFPRSLSDLGGSKRGSGRARPGFRSFEANSRRYLTRRIGKMGRSPASAADSS